MQKKQWQTSRKKGIYTYISTLVLLNFFRTIIDKLKNENNALKDLIVFIKKKKLIFLKWFKGEIK